LLVDYEFQYLISHETHFYVSYIDFNNYPMEKDLITQALKEIVVKGRKGLPEVQRYLLKRFRIKIESFVLSRRLKKLLNEEKAVA
jgi:chromosomal replication initiation ATPase DnaA